MIKLSGRSVEHFVSQKFSSKVFVISPDPDDDSKSVFSNQSSHTQPKLHLLFGETSTSIPEHNFIRLPSAFEYLSHGNVVEFSDDYERVRVLYRGSGTMNSLLLTEQCDNYCIMCSQPPKEKADAWLLESASACIDLIQDEFPEVCFTGGEPTIYGSQFNELVQQFFSRHAKGSLHILSNGRKFSDKSFAEEYVNAVSGDAMIGIPLYGAESTLHDFVVQSPGAFEETLAGILNLAELGAQVEIRVVVHKQTAAHLYEIARFLSRNLPFVSHVAVMGLEMMGLARANFSEVWIDPIDYQIELQEAVSHLLNLGLNVSIYNHQLCLLPDELRQFSRQSISDWKNEYDPICHNCDLQNECGGFFASAQYASSRGIHPLRSDGLPKESPALDETIIDDSTSIHEKNSVTWRRRKIPLNHLLN